MGRKANGASLTIFLVLCLFLTSNGWAQGWNRTYDNELRVNSTSSVLELADGSFFCVAWDYDNSSGGLMSLRLDNVGDTVWMKSFQYPGRIYNDGASGGILLKDSVFYVAGTVVDSLSDADALLAAFDFDGDTLWTRKYGGMQFESLGCIDTVSGGGFILFGIRQTGPIDMMMIRTDNLGNEIWTTYFTDPVFKRCISGFEAADGGFVLSGSRHISSSNSSLYIVKTDLAGNLDWNVDLGGPWEDNMAFVEQKSNGNILVAGAVRVNETGALQGYLAELEPEGGLIWDETYTADRIVFFTRPIPLNNGIAVAGSFWEDGNTKGLFQKTDSVGDLLWQRVFQINTFGNHYFYDVRSTMDNGFIMSGSAFDSLGLSQDAWLVKVDSFGCLVPGCEIFDGIETQYTDLSQYLQLAPNPATESTQLSFNLPDGFTPNGPLTLSLVGVDGRLVQEEVLPRQHVYSHTLQLEGLSKGVYFVHLRDGSRWLAGKRLIVQ